MLSLTAYLDESGTHDGSAVTIMAGAMATAAQWARFESCFSALKRKHGFKVFHTKKFKRRAGDFKGWNPLQQISLMMDLAAISEGAFVEGLSFTLSNEDYAANYRGGEAPRRMRIESKYGLCFKNCLMFFVLEALRFADGTPTKLHFVLESGHPNWNEVNLIFAAMKKEMRDMGTPELLGDITFADKEQCDPLMMADFLAHATYMNRRDGTGPDNEQPFIVDTQQRPKSTGVTHLSIKPGGLSDLKGELIKRLNARSASRWRPASG